MDDQCVQMKLGDSQLDEDHETLLLLSRALLDVPYQDFARSIEKIRREARAHFDREDEDLRRLGGSNSVCHLDEHRLVLESMDEVYEIVSDPSTTREVASRLISSFSMELLRWLPEHVSQMDAGLAEMRSKKRFGGVPVIFKGLNSKG